MLLARLVAANKILAVRGMDAPPLLILRLQAERRGIKSVAMVGCLNGGSSRVQMLRMRKIWL